MNGAERETDSGLLTIKQAARFLHVSEVSLRRWTDSGVLPCLRVGGRRERRFREADLLAFLDGRPAEAGSEPHNAAPQVCLQGLAIPYGRHLCAFYTNDHGREKLALPFLIEGLTRGERCFLVAGSSAMNALASALDGALRASDCAAAGELVCRPASPEPQDTLDYFRAEFALATRHDYAPLRVLGDMAGFIAAGASLAALIEFEHRFDRELAHRYPVVSLCQYDARAFSGVAVLEALGCHGDLFEYPLRQFLGS
ncbi:MAG: MEDS domain-containing protein [Gammaproteobacteria bacterium]